MQSQQKVVRNFLMELDTSADTYMEISWYLKETLKSNIFCDSLFYHLEAKSSLPISQILKVEK